MNQKIKQVMVNRPKRTYITRCFYLWGPTGVGKTRNVQRTLDVIKELYDIDYYFKPAGFSRFWDGYNNQDIVILDDPVNPAEDRNADKQQLLNVLSTGHCHEHPLFQ